MSDLNKTGEDVPYTIVGDIDNPYEINEDNCVLDENELLNIDTALFMMGAGNKGSEEYFDNLYQKITKLNDIVKEKKYERE